MPRHEGTMHLVACPVAGHTLQKHPLRSQNAGALPEAGQGAQKERVAPAVQGPGGLAVSLKPRSGPLPPRSQGHGGPPVHHVCQVPLEALAVGYALVHRGLRLHVCAWVP